MNQEYIKGLKKALEIVECTARFGIEKTVAAIMAELEATNVKETSKNDK